MARLPTDKEDSGQWGLILNEYLTVEHNANGTLKDRASLNVTGAPTVSTHATNKAYVDGLVANYASQAYVTSATATAPKFFATEAARNSYFSSNTPVNGQQAWTEDLKWNWTYYNGYWLPERGTSICGLVKNTVDTITNNTDTSIVCNTTFNGSRNYGNWYNTTTGAFTPQAPGFYEVTGGVSFQASTPGLRFVFFRFNGSTNYGGQNQLSVGGATPTVVSARPATIYCNGTSDYIELIAWQNSGANLGVYTSANSSLSSFSAKYLGL